MLYHVWRACERFGMIPAGIKREWDDNTEWGKTLLIAYDQVRTIETQKQEAELLSAIAGIKRA